MCDLEVRLQLILFKHCRFVFTNTVSSRLTPAYSSVSDEYGKKKHPNDVAKNEGLTSASPATGAVRHADLCVSVAVSIAGLLLLRPGPG